MHNRSFVPLHPALNREKGIENILRIATALSAGAILLIFSLLVYFSLPLFSSGGVLEILSWIWQPQTGKFGILAMFAASLCLSVLALLLALPLALGVCCLVVILTPGRLSRFLLFLVHFMTSIPTVIYGFVSVFLLVPCVRDLIDGGSGFSLISAALALSILILPTIVLVLQAKLQQVDPMLRLSMEALGLTPIQQLHHVLIPASSQGLVVAAILGFGRAVGDTLISLMLAGNAPQFPGSLFISVRTLSAHIALVLATDSQSMAYRSVFASGLLLFFLMAAVNLLIRRYGQRVRRHEESN